MIRCCTAAGRETDNDPRTEAEGREVAPGSAHKKMLKTKIEPTMCMKTNTQMTISPKQKTAFLRNCSTLDETYTHFAETVVLLSAFAEVQKCEE